MRGFTHLQPREYKNMGQDKMQKANGKLWATSNNGEIEIRSITEADLEESLDVLNKSFFRNESVCNACEINLPENSQARSELIELCRITALDGISLVAKDVKTGKAVSVCFNKLQYLLDNKDEEPFFIKFRKEKTHSPQAQRLMDFMIEVDGETDVFEMFNLDCVVELMFLGTLPEYGGKGIARQLSQCTIELSRQLSQGQGLELVHPSLHSKRPQAVTALFSSQFSQKIGKALNFTVINTVHYTSYSYNGKTFDQRINPLHKTCEHVIIVF